MLERTPVARRRFLQGVGVVAVVGFDPIRRSWATEATAQSAPNGGGLVRLPRLDGVLVTSGPDLAAAADDFGHTIHRTPVAVLKPGSISDIVEMVRYAKQYDIKIAMRGQGHATFGQAQVEAGIVIDSSTLTTIHEVSATNGALVDPGVRWRTLLDATLPKKLTPPTLPNYLDLTVGGNLCGGGIGGACHRNGAVVDNVLEIQVVTGKGELRTCSPTQNATLFYAVLGGLGQFAIIVRARIKLAPARSTARTYTINYPDVATFLEDAKKLALDERFDHIEGQANPDGNGGYGTVTLLAAKYFEPSQPPNDSALTGDLLSDDVQVADMPYRTFLERIDPIVSLLKMVGAWGLPHPWFDVFIPHSKTEGFVGGILSTLTLADTGNGPVILYPMRRSKLTRPFLRVPDSEEVFYLFDVLRFSPPDPNVVNAQIAQNRAWFDAARALGGKRYAIGSLPFSQEDWKEHFSPLWPAVVLAKLAYDPSNILTPGQGVFPPGSCG